MDFLYFKDLMHIIVLLPKGEKVTKLQTL